MNLFFKLLTLAFSCIQIVDSKKVRVVPDDEFYPYSIDNGVIFAKEYLLDEFLTYEQIDDDKVMVGGYVEWTISLDPTLPFQGRLRTQYLYQSTWYEGPIQLILTNCCAETVNPSRMWYNLTKLWTNCPPKKGDKWVIENQIVDVQFMLPPSVAVGKWKFHCMFFQGLIGAAHKFGGTLQLELVEV